MRHLTTRAPARRRATARAVAVVALLGCAPRVAPVAAPVPLAPTVVTAPALASACFVADTAGPPRDSILTVGVGSQTDASLDCAGRAIPLAPAPAVVTLDVPRNADLRDILDRGPRGPDVIVTSDPDVIAYAGRTTEWIIAPLPWTTTYAIAGIDSAQADLLPAGRDALARDAVTAEARGALPPFAWLTDTACTRAIALTSGEPRPIIGYPAGDATARQLAERLAARGTGTRRVAPFAPAALPGVLASRAVDLVVFPIARDAGTHCGTRGNEPVIRGAAPLVDTRAHVIVRRGSGAAFIIAADGSLRFIRRVAP